MVIGVSNQVVLNISEFQLNSNSYSDLRSLNPLFQKMNLILIKCLKIYENEKPLEGLLLLYLHISAIK